MICQYCAKPRIARGYFGSSPVSLCAGHVTEHGHDFDRVIRLTDDEVLEEARVRAKREPLQ